MYHEGSFCCSKFQMVSMPTTPSRPRSPLGFTTAIVLLWSAVLATGMAANIVSEADEAAVAMVVAATVKAGFPDGTRDEVYGGAINVAVNIDPDQEQLPLPGEESIMQETTSGSSLVTYRYRFGGLHLKRSDGTWILGFRRKFKADADDQVLTAAARRLDVARLSADAAAAHPYDPSPLKEWLDQFEPARREAAQSALTLMVPVSQYLQLGTDDFAPAVVMMHRAGWKDATLACVAISNERAGRYWLMRPWIEPDAVFDPTGEYPQANATEASWRTSQKSLVPEAPAVALRRAMHRWCRNQLMQDKPLITPRVAAAVCRATLDPGDPQRNGPRTDALLAATALPAHPPEGADLPTRLASWGAPADPSLIVRGSNEGAGIRNEFRVPEEAYTPERKDLDALIALLGDGRPSRFIDFSGARSIGDNAFRAVAGLISADPRALADHPMNTPWTAEERTKAAAAVQAWWETNRLKYLTE